MRPFFHVNAARGRWLAAAVLGAVVCVAGCGGPDAGEPGAPGPGQPGAASPARWRVEIPSALEQARYALNRLLTGPVPQTALEIPDQHPETLRAARQDLIVLGAETVQLLRDPALRASVTGPGQMNLDGWHNLLEVLAAIPDKPVALCLAWTEGVLARASPGLSLRAVDVLASTRSAEAAPALLALLEASSDDRVLQREAWRALGALPAPWPARALAFVARRGVPEVWLDVAPLLGEQLDVPGAKAGAEGLLAWWALLAEPGGPRGPAGQPRQKTLPWSLLYSRLAPSAPRPGPDGPAGLRCPGPYPAHVLDALGWFGAAPGASPVAVAYALTFVGTEPAADARCLLARSEQPAYVASVLADRASSDPVRHEKAKHCMLDGGPAVSPAARAQGTLALLKEAADLERAGETPTVSQVAEATRRLPSSSDPGGPVLLLRVLSELRPVASWLATLKAAYTTLLAAQDGQAHDLAKRWLRGESAAERGLALELAQSTRDPALLPALGELLERAEPAGRANLMRVMWWIHAGGGAEPGSTAAFARAYAEWLERASDTQAASLATGLLDLGDEGERLFVAGLNGRRQALFVDAASRLPGTLALPVAEALADLVGPGLAAPLRRTVLLTLWRAATAPAAPAVAAIQGRLDPAERAAVGVVLDAVRHRAAR